MTSSLRESMLSTEVLRERSSTADLRQTLTSRARKTGLFSEGEATYVGGTWEPANTASDASCSAPSGPCEAAAAEDRDGSWLPMTKTKTLALPFLIRQANHSSTLSQVSSKCTEVLP